MPNSIGPTGITIAQQPELYANQVAAYQNIYGSTIDLASNSPDGQMLNINLQTALDLANLLLQINNMFDPDFAVGVLLDQRVAINGIQRKAGTFTATNVTLVTTQSLNLYGLDQTVQPIYTVADNAGNNWQLSVTQLGLSAGTNVLQFQAAIPGAVQSVPNTITVPVTIVLGVQSINNPTTYTTLGVNEESDAALRLRRAQSVSLASQGYRAGLIAALNNLNGVTSVFEYENDTNATDIDGVPGHSIWVIVGGTATPASIAQVIYDYRNAGAGMFGAQSFTITQADGSPFVIYWDNVTPENLFISFTANSVDGINPPNIAGILAGLPEIFVPGVDQEVNITQLGTFVQDIDPNTYLTFTSMGTPAAGGFSTSATGTYTYTLSPSTKAKQFVVSAQNTIILPMILSPYNPISMTPIALNEGGTQQFTGLGGYGTLTYTFVTNNSGGTINSSTGFYTAGASPGTDTIKVTDSLSNMATAVITVAV